MINKKLTLRILGGLLIVVGLGMLLPLPRKPINDIRAASVKIVTRELNHGGTGIILQSTSVRSSILTNDHVCKAIKNGGIVRSRQGDYQVASIIESEVSDLCLVQVMADLKVNTKISEHEPLMYDKALVSGHPALYPNVVSHGHFSGRDIIPVMTGMRPCTQEELSSPLSLVCMFFGGMPVVKSYESLLVTATIMPGSSGSGVYNTNNELAGVVFAGSEGFGYAWTVPYNQVLNFLFVEHKNLKVQNIDQELSLMKQDESSKKIKEILQGCETNTNELIQHYCSILKRDMIWRGN